MNAKKRILPMSEWRHGVSPKAPTNCAKGVLARSCRGFSARNVGFAKNSYLASQIALRQLGKHIES
jgi:hypothetical protein